MCGPGVSSSCSCLILKQCYICACRLRYRRQQWMNTEREDVTAAHCKNTIIRESDSGFFFGDMKTSNERYNLLHVYKSQVCVIRLI